MALLDTLRLQVFWNKISLAVNRIIQERTRKGIGVGGEAFKPYSEQYAKKRGRAGLPINPPDLKFDEKSGMMKRIDHEIFNDYKAVEIFINSPEKEQLAIYHNIMGAGKSKVIRRFWGLSEEEKEKIYELIDETLPALAAEAVRNHLGETLKKLKTEHQKITFRDDQWD